jgi:hypothetical protein
MSGFYDFSSGKEQDRLWYMAETYFNYYKAGIFDNPAYEISRNKLALFQWIDADYELQLVLGAAYVELAEARDESQLIMWRDGTQSTRSERTAFERIQYLQQALNNYTSSPIGAAAMRAAEMIFPNEPQRQLGFAGVVIIASDVASSLSAAKVKSLEGNSIISEAGFVNNFQILSIVKNDGNIELVKKNFSDQLDMPETEMSAPRFFQEIQSDGQALTYNFGYLSGYYDELTNAIEEYYLPIDWESEASVLSDNEINEVRDQVSYQNPAPDLNDDSISSQLTTEQLQELEQRSADEQTSFLDDQLASESLRMSSIDSGSDFYSQACFMEDELEPSQKSEIFQEQTDEDANLEFSMMDDLDGTDSPDNQVELSDEELVTEFLSDTDQSIPTDSDVDANLTINMEELAALDDSSPMLDDLSDQSDIDDNTIFSDPNPDLTYEMTDDISEDNDLQENDFDDNNSDALQDDDDNNEDADDDLSQDESTDQQFQETEQNIDQVEQQQNDSDQPDQADQVDQPNQGAG